MAERCPSRLKLRGDNEVRCRKCEHSETGLHSDWFGTADGHWVKITWTTKAYVERQMGRAFEDGELRTETEALGD